MADSRGIGPDLVIAGAARSGTSLLAAHLAAHPDIDPGTVKEPNYFSRYHDRGPDWYDGLFSKREAGVVRFDASTSYTYPQFPEALTRLAATSPDAFVVYSVRDPLARAVSHYLYYRHYFRREPEPSFGAAVRASSYYTDVSDYSVWLPRLRAEFSAERLLVVPFDAVTSASAEVASVIFGSVGLSASTAAEKRVQAHQNQVVEFRAESVRRAVTRLRRNPLYLKLRASVGPHRVRRVRSLLTRRTELPSPRDAVRSCDEDQLQELRELEARARVAAREYLAEQDQRRGLNWASYWDESTSLLDPVPSERGATPTYPA